MRRISCWLASLYIRLVSHPGAWQVIGGDIPKRFWDDDKPFILAFWHGRLLMMPYCWDHGKTIYMLISQHRDGQLIARTVKCDEGHESATFGRSIFQVPHVDVQATAIGEETAVAGGLVVGPVMQHTGICTRGHN